jgi:hypothetical protein
MIHPGQKLSTLVTKSLGRRHVRKINLHAGDWMFVTTCNSIYRILTLGDGKFMVSGGYFDRNGKSPLKVHINGCTWGGSVINVDIAAGYGLCLEFGNRVVTSPIKNIFIYPNGTLN